MAFSDQLTRFFQFKRGGQIYFGTKDPYVLLQEDDSFLLCDPADTTKCVRFDAGGITTGTTRVITLPNASGTLGTDPIAADVIALTGAAGEESVFNEDGVDSDVRMEGGTATSLFVADAGDDAVYIGTTVAGALASISATEINFNDAGADINTRAEGNTATNLLIVDAGDDAVYIGTTVAGDLAKIAPAGIILNEGGADINTRVEGENDANLIFVDASTDSIGIGTATPGAWLHLKAGTTALAPLLIPAGTNLTTPVAGGVEYDGDVFYISNEASQRGLVPSYQLARVDSATALVGDTSEQAMFAAGGDALTVIAGATYRYRCVAQLTTGATSCTVAFSLNGDASFTSSSAVSLGVDAASGTAAAAFMNNSVGVGTAFVVCAAGTGVNKRFTVEGDFEVNAAGTIIPSVTFSADPQGDETVNVGTFFECWRIGANPVTEIGPWA